MATAAMYIILKQVIQAILLVGFVCTDKYSRTRFVISTRIKVKCIPGHIPSGIPSNTEEL